MSNAFILENKFENRAPNPQNAFDIFKGRWASDIGELFEGASTGGIKLFTSDPRPIQAAQSLGNSGRLDGMNILELGPLDGAHSYHLENLGAKSVYAVEANIEAFLKCLIVKEFLNLNVVKFGLGDFVEYLSSTNEKYDMIFNSGCLYHMSDPIQLLKFISLHTDKMFLWTHYHEKDLDPIKRVSLPVNRYGYEATYYEAVYPNQAAPTFWGGNKITASWLSKEDILGALAFFGFNKVSVLSEARENIPTGPHITISAERTSD